jgi:hypothetical protein
MEFWQTDFLRVKHGTLEMIIEVSHEWIGQRARELLAQISLHGQFLPFHLQYTYEGRVVKAQKIVHKPEFKEFRPYDIFSKFRKVPDSTKQAVIFSHGNFSFLWTCTGSPFRPFLGLFRNTNPYQSRLLPTFRYFEYRYRLPNGNVVCVINNTYITYCFRNI